MEENWLLNLLEQAKWYSEHVTPCFCVQAPHKHTHPITNNAHKCKVCYNMWHMYTTNWRDRSLQHGTYFLLEDTVSAGGLSFSRKQDGPN